LDHSATAIAPNLPIELIGVRPGEKIHEVMCPADEAHLTLEFDDHYVIQPAIQFSQGVDYTRDALGDKGVSVSDEFEYISSKNSHFLDIETLNKMNMDL
jgi:UDP-N-acetylglucosamine 4,6-dehydratase